jgi:hypothetical protein
MNLKKTLKTKLRSFFGIQQVQEQIIEIRQVLEKLDPNLVLSNQNINQDSGNDKFIIKLDYPPSRDLRPRWGDSHPPHQGLINLFNKNRDRYIEVFRGVSKLKPFFDRINQDYSYDQPSEPGWLGGAINAIDTALLYYFITQYKPKIYLEIGSGISTLFAARAKRDHNLNTQIISIDPQPRAEVDAVCNQVIRAGLETTDLSIFDQLEAGDIVFMDGSHRSFMNSDVTVFMLDVLPMLKSGVIVHFHDIVLPFDYPDTFIDWYWNEQYIVAAYLLAAGDEKLDVMMPSRFMSYTDEMKQELQPILQGWKAVPEVWLCGGSLWFTNKQ